MHSNALMATKLLLVTSNLGSLFEESIIEERWFAEIVKVVGQLDPDMIAIHCQEIGGKEFEVTMSKVHEFVRKLKRLPCFLEYNRFRVFMDTDFNSADAFTALGNIYLIHKRAPSFYLWNFNTRDFVEVTGEVIACQTEGMCEQLSSNYYHHKDKFPNDYFPAVKWSRKGFLHTRWRLNNKLLNLVNIHLFHDEDNLIALEQSPSAYSQYRRRALHHTLDSVKRNLEESNESVFLFGDFNFRLDLTSVVKHVTTEYHQPQFIRGGDGNLQKVLYRNPISTDVNDSLCIERRKFYPNSHVKLFHESFRELLQFDSELRSFKELHESPITFQPSYPFSEELSEGNKYMEKRCPGWCDRVLMNDFAKQTLDKSTIPHIYDMMAKDVCTGDHKPVFLFFSIDTTSDSSVPITTGPQEAQQAEDQ